MKKVSLFVLFAILLVACQKPAPVPATFTPVEDQPPTAIVLPDATETAIPSPTNTPKAVIGDASPTPEEVEEDQEAEETPEDDLEAEATAESAADDVTPTTEFDTDPGDEPTPLPTSEAVGEDDEPSGQALFDPEQVYGIPQLVFPSSETWTSFANPLPDTDNLKMEALDGDLYVTGKNVQWDTWWFTWPILSNFYAEMSVTTEQCSGKDHYGFITRGTRPGDSAQGYMVLFSCDGNYAVNRLDSLNPYTAEALLLWTETDALRDGANKTNRVGVLLEDNAISIYANGELLTPLPVYDDSYTDGRFGLFVNAWNTQNFTYIVDQIKVWRLP
ncbi:MAG: hypothetical protein JXB38_15690 [Anaerolineales bacterium]|nr:hypothetical protein [Anaerolineales bacterium]